MKRLLKTCIVCYNNDPKVIQKTIDYFLDQNIDSELIVVDHSPSNFLEKTVSHYNSKTVSYFFRGNINNGYGGGNNFGFDQGDESEYFLILNPDVFLINKSLEKLIDTITKNESIGIIVPKILNEDSTIQKLMKGYPTVLALLARRFKLLQKIKLIKKSLIEYEMVNFNYNEASNVQIASGCFMLVRSKDFIKVGKFDERYFLYFEDYDLCLKILKLNKLIYYYPEVEIIHLWNRGAHKSIRHFYLFFRSMIQFFSKWGWKWY
ncbi:glycosyltransferase [Leptospira sp. GIMC2001]|uniref:glycosyltransferase n=1 Tax=Leptospira sp. GIMC2001 TaxID=1513297 RepID=UPI00234A8CF1|nr:glycosyltransferase [Leptospira sp. GIMC2001]WCL51280.1 glycosyltransferase [Leptospira sp. GIMC2001]